MTDVLSVPRLIISKMTEPHTGRTFFRLHGFIRPGERYTEDCFTKGEAQGRRKLLIHQYSNMEAR